MPNLPNAKKALRQNKKREAHNRQYKNRIKKVARKINDLIKDGKNQEAEKLLPTYFKAIDKAAKRNILHKNTANRRKSLYSRKVAGEKPKDAQKNQSDSTAADSNSQDK